MAVVPIVSLLPRSPAASGDARQTRRDEDAYASVPPGQLAVRDKTQGAKLRLAAVIYLQGFLLNRIEAITACAPHAIQLPLRSGDMDVLPVGGNQYRFRYIKLSQ